MCVEGDSKGKVFAVQTRGSEFDLQKHILKYLLRRPGMVLQARNPDMEDTEAGRSPELSDQVV